MSMMGFDLGSIFTTSLQSGQQLGVMREQAKLIKDFQGPKVEIEAETERLANVAKTDELLEAREASIERSMDKLAAQTAKDPWLEKLIKLKQDRYEATSKKNT